MRTSPHNDPVQTEGRDGKDGKHEERHDDQKPGRLYGLNLFRSNKRVDEHDPCPDGECRYPEHAQTSGGTKKPIHGKASSSSRSSRCNLGLRVFPGVARIAPSTGAFLDRGVGSLET